MVEKNMKRDLELIRKLLVFFDERDAVTHIEAPPIEGYDAAAIKYHLVLMNDAKLLRCEEVKTNTGFVIYLLPFELTWEGPEFLGKIRSQFVWEEVNAEI